MLSGPGAPRDFMLDRAVLSSVREKFGVGQAMPESRTRLRRRSICFAALFSSLSSLDM